MPTLAMGMLRFGYTPFMPTASVGMAPRAIPLPVSQIFQFLFRHSEMMRKLSFRTRLVFDYLRMTENSASERVN